jgi:hypothetical protein
MKSQLEQLLKRCEIRKDVLEAKMSSKKFNSNDNKSLIYKSCLSLSIRLIDDIMKDIKVIIANEKKK